MNVDNETVVSGEFHKKLREAGADQGYVAVPPRLTAQAKRVLAGRPIADMDARFKGALNKRERYLARKAAKRAGNRRHEENVKRPIVQDLLTGK